MIAHIIGRVLPERTAVELVPIERTDSLGARYWFKIEASQFHVRFESNESLDPTSAFLCAEAFARFHVKALGLCLGTGYYVEAVQCIVEGGESLVFGVRTSGLEIPDWQHHWDVHFRYAVCDYTDAMRLTEDCPFLCYRSIEGVRHAFECDSERAAWESMHAALGTNKDEITSKVKGFADAIRHGDWTDFKPHTAADRHAMLQISKDVLLKYMDYRMRDQGAS